MNTLLYHFRHLNWIKSFLIISIICYISNLSAQNSGDLPYGLSNAAWQKLHTPQSIYVKDTPYYLTADEYILNGSFESGDFSDWIVEDISDPFFTLQVGASGFNPWGGFFISEPTDGEFAALHGFDGGGPGYITMIQDIVLDSSAAVLHFDYRAAWDLINYGATIPRTFVVNLEPSGGGEVIQSDTILVADPFGNNLVEDTGNLHGIVLLNSLPDTTIRVIFEWYIPETFTGPAFFQLDNVFIQEVAEGQEIYVMPDLLNFNYVLVNDTSVAHDMTIYNIGTEDLTINTLSITDPQFSFISLPDLPLTLSAGESETLEIVFAPIDSGLVNANLTITSDDTDNPSVDLTLSGHGIQIMPAEPGICYASTGNIDGGRLLTIAPSTGTATVIGDIDVNAMPAIAINSEGYIYGLDGSSGDIYLIDAATGYSVFSTSSNIEGLTSIAFDQNDILYGYNQWTYDLYSIDLQTGLSLIIGNSGVDLRGLAFHPFTNNLFGSGHFDLYTIDITDGSAFLIGNTLLDMALTDLSFDINGNLYASEGGANEENYFVSLNQSTGQGTRIGEIGFQSVSGLALYNVPIEGRHISVTPEIIDFGTIEVQDTSAVYVISVGNVGTDVLTVTDISTVDTNVILSDLPILPIVLPSRSSQTFEVSISVSDTGVFNKTISVSSDDPDKPLSNVQLNGRAIIIQPAKNGLCYASTGNIDGGRFIQIDPANGTGTLLGETGLQSVPAIAINSEGKIYGLDENSGDIYSIDAESGFAVDVIQTDIDGLMAIAFDTNDVLYGFSGWSSNLYTINLQSGLSTVIGYVGYGLRGISFNPINNTLWGADNYNLLTINTSNASYTLIGNFDIDYPISDLGFDIAGNLFATAGGGQNQENYFVLVDKSSAQGTIIGEIGFQSVSGLSFYNIPLEGKHISVQPEQIDFSTFVSGDTSHVKLVSISNIGTEVLTVSDIVGSDSTVILENLPVLPVILPSRASQTFEVSISVSDTGDIHKMISIISDDPDNALIEIPLSGRTIFLHPAENGFCYASTGHKDGANFLRITPSTGQGDLIGNTGLNAVPAIAINSEGWIYGIEARSSDIYKIDATTGYAVGVIHTDIEELVAIAFDTSNVLYGYSSYTSSLYTINLETGKSTLIGHSVYGLRGLSFHPLDNSLWGTYHSELYSINTNDGSYVYVGNTNLSYSLTDLAFDIAGNLFATSGGNQTEENQFVSLDTETGAATIIGEIGFESVSGLAFYTAPLEGRQISVSPDTLNFRNIEVGDSSYVREIHISNVGTDMLTVTDISASDTTVILANMPNLPFVIQSRSTQVIETQMFISDTGIFNKSVTIASDDLDNPESNVILSGKSIIIASADSGKWYASTGHNDGGRFLSIDPSSGEGTLIGSTGLDAVPAIAINSEGKIYGVNGSSGWLCRIDGSSGKAYDLLNTNLSHITSLSFDINDQLYAYGQGTNSLCRVDLDNGEIELIGFMDYGFRGIAFDPVDNSLWGAQWFDLFKINISDASTEWVGSTMLDRAITDIKFDIFGNLFATAGGNHWTNNLATIDKSTGLGALIGEIGFDNVSGFAIYNVPIEGRHLRASPSELIFGDIIVDDSSSIKSLIIGNIGTDELTLENLTLSDTAVIHLEIPPLPLVIPSLEFITLDVRLTPDRTGALNELITLISNDPDNLSLDIPVEAEVFSVAPADSGSLYATTGHKDGGRLLKIDPATGQGTLIGDTGLDAVPGLAINSQGEIYCVDAFEGNLYRIDAVSGRALLVGPTNVMRMISILFDKDDNLYGYSDEMGSIYKIDPKIGSSTQFLEIEQALRSLAFNPVDNSLWASTNDDRIFLIDQSDGTLETVGITTLPSGIPTINFDMLGFLYGAVHLEWNSSQLFTFDISSKEVRIIGDIGFESVSSLAFYNVPKPGLHLYVSPKSIDFGLTAVGDTSRSKAVTVYNIGTDALNISDITVEEPNFILNNVSSLPWNLSSGESQTFDVVFFPADLDFATSVIEISSNDSEHPVHQIGISGEGAKISIDGSFAESEYVLIGSKLNNNSGFGPDVDVTNIYYASDEHYIMLGIECSVQNIPNQYNAKPDGLGIFLNFSGESGMPVGEPLAHWEEFDHHFLNGGLEVWDGGMEFTADFEVDYIFAVYSDGSSDKIFIDASTFIWDNPQLIQYIDSIQFAYQGSTGPGSKKGIEFRIPLSDINAESSDEFQVFTTMVSATGFFSNVSVPGNITVWDNPGFNPNFYTNQTDDNCGCPNPNTTIGNGPYHTDWNTIVVGINEDEILIPTEYGLSQNYPNPFNPLTTIKYQLPEAAEIELVIYNILGQEIYTLINGKKQAGYHSQAWNATDQYGNAVASGLYIYRLDAKGVSGRKFVQVKKMVVLK
jgi:hypothetical protein